MITAAPVAASPSAWMLRRQRSTNSFVGSFMTQLIVVLHVRQQRMTKMSFACCDNDRRITWGSNRSAVQQGAPAEWSRQFEALGLNPSYGSIVASCFKGAEDLNRWTVANDWAVAYRKYSRALRR